MRAVGAADELTDSEVAYKPDDDEKDDEDDDEMMGWSW